MIKLRKFNCIACGKIVEKCRHENNMKYCTRACYQKNQPSHLKKLEREKKMKLEKLK